MLGKPRQPLKTTKMKRKENENCVCALSIFTPSRIEVRHFFALKETSANQFVIALYSKMGKRILEDICLRKDPRGFCVHDSQLALGWRLY